VKEGSIDKKVKAIFLISTTDPRQPLKQT